MNRKKAISILFILFLVSLLLRIPNLNRDISKHHEFNSAVVLINLQSWRQAKGGSVFHFIPLLNYQNPGDKIPDTSYYSIDRSGNTMYLSFGPAWYLIPYWVYNLLHLQPNPLCLQIINLFFNLMSLALLFLFLEDLLQSKVKGNYESVLIGCFVFLFSPGTLWYLGNGYINIGIMTPLVIGFLWFQLRMIQYPALIDMKRLLVTVILIVALLYFDWFVLALCGVTSLIMLIRCRKNRRFIRLILVQFFGCISGIALLYWQFSSYAGSRHLLHYWFARSGSRTVANIDVSLGLSAYFLLNFVTAYLPIFLLIIIAYLKMRKDGTRIVFSAREWLFIKAYAGAALLYDLVLFEWSSEHEYSVLPWAILFAFLACRLLTESFTRRQWIRLCTLYLLFSVGQYYFINRPGRVSREGTAYAAFREFGDSLKQVDPEYKIFINIKRNPMIEYYAGRNLTIVTDLDSARRFMVRWQVHNAVWVEQRNFEFQKLTYLSY